MNRLALPAMALALLAALARGREGEAPAAPPRTLNAPELAALLDRVEAKLGQIRSLRADFVQEKHLSLFTDVVASEGVMLFVRPNTVRFEMTKPYQSVLIAAGKSVARYEFLDGRWQKMMPGGAAVVRIVTEQIASWLEGKFRAKSGLYEISAAEAGGIVTLTLLPRDAKFREFVTGIELALAREETHFTSVTIREPGGDFTRMLFAHPRHNVELPQRLFDTGGSAPAPLPERGKP
jgi:outer membrane lipoprotein-sorting protein